MCVAQLVEGVPNMLENLDSLPNTVQSRVIILALRKQRMEDKEVQGHPSLMGVFEVNLGWLQEALLQKKQTNKRIK